MMNGYKDFMMYVLVLICAIGISIGAIIIIAEILDVLKVSHNYFWSLIFYFLITTGITITSVYLEKKKKKKEEDR
jgi:predicted tellurium resistance membrane protein TerC